MKTPTAVAALVAVSTLALSTLHSARAADNAHGEGWAAIKQAVAVVHSTAGNKSQKINRSRLLFPALVAPLAQITRSAASSTLCAVGFFARLD